MPQAANACRRTAAKRPKPGLPRKFYRPRDHEASPFFKIVHDRFEEFERVYPERFQRRYGYWRPVIRSSIDKFLKCGDVKEGFARVKCKDCGEEYFVAFSCRQRSCCPSCDQKRALLLAYRLEDEVLAEVPHLQWVFTIPKRGSFSHPEKSFHEVASSTSCLYSSSILMACSFSMSILSRARQYSSSG